MQLGKKLSLMDPDTNKHYNWVFCPWGVLPYMGYRGMCGPKGYGFSAVLVINKVSIF